MSTTNTPRTDAQSQFPIASQDGLWTVDIDFARTLEHELQQANAEAAILRASLQDMLDEIFTTERERGHMALHCKACGAEVSQGKPHSNTCRVAKADAVFESTTAGSELLERMRKMEALAKSAEEFARVCIADGEVSQLDAQTLYEQARDALAQPKDPK